MPGRRWRRVWAPRATTTCSAPRCSPAWPRCWARATPPGCRPGRAGKARPPPPPPGTAWPAATTANTCWPSRGLCCASRLDDTDIAQRTGSPRWARKRLRQRHRKLLQQIRKADLFDPIERHQVRIEAKKLRYALDFLASLWPPEQLAAVQRGARAGAGPARRDERPRHRAKAAGDRPQGPVPTGCRPCWAPGWSSPPRICRPMLKALKQAPVPWK